MIRTLVEVLVALAWSAAFVRQRRRHAADLHRVRYLALQARVARIKAEAERDEARREYAKLALCVSLPPVEPS